MSILQPHVLNVKFCKHHREVGTTDRIADFLYGCVVPLEEAGIDVIKAGLACGCTVWMRHNEKRALPAAPPPVGSGTPAAQCSCGVGPRHLASDCALVKRRTKGGALRPLCNCRNYYGKGDPAQSQTRSRELISSFCPLHGLWMFRSGN